jgi:hypothetical protein
MKGNGDLPGEHGFRFFPGYYQHLPLTLEGIPDPRRPGRAVIENLVEATETDFARTDKAGPVRLPDQRPRSLHELAQVFRFQHDVDISETEALFFAYRMLSFLCSSDTRRYEVYEKMSWFDFCCGEKPFSDAYNKYLADGLKRRTVAATGHDVSARTVGLTLARIIASWFGSASIDRVLNGPTSDRWITPWRQYLEGRDVTFVPDATLERLEWSGTHVKSASVVRNGTSTPIEADYYIVAVPVERMQTVAEASGMRGAGLGIDGIFALKSDWMNGIQFYLRKDVALTRGHTIYVDSAYSLTSICQQVFWEDVSVGALGDGSVRSIVSIDISDWETCAEPPCKLPAKALTREGVRDEVWRQFTDHVRVTYGITLDWRDVVDWYLDPAIVERPGGTENEEPLFINKVDSWSSRPESTIALDNLLLAADYVRTNTDLATMEAANEAGRRAVRGILRQLDMPTEQVKIFEFPEPRVFRGNRRHDEEALHGQVVGFAQLGIEPVEVRTEW